MVRQTIVNRLVLHVYFTYYSLRLPTGTGKNHALIFRGAGKTLHLFQVSCVTCLSATDAAIQMLRYRTDRNRARLCRTCDVGKDGVSDICIGGITDCIAGRLIRKNQPHVVDIQIKKPRALLCLSFAATYLVMTRISCCRCRDLHKGYRIISLPVRFYYCISLGGIIKCFFIFLYNVDLLISSSCAASVMFHLCFLNIL